jgi:non-heme chloroperoxidase
MATITTKDGTQIYYKDWGAGQPIVFSHGWPLTADDWDAQMLFFGQHGYRVIAHDRRGHGRSTQTWDGNEMDTYADDLATLTEKLGLKDAIHVGHSTGGGEVVHYIARHGAKRVAKAAIISAVPPLMLKTEKNPTANQFRPSTSSALPTWPTVRSSTKISPCRFTDTTGRAQKFLKESARSGGYRA